ncbi:FdhF/YdeP family oxidoreductase [Chryseobacterium indologenes]|uniref:FdhF/YdeP family oxidoreductase n=1 Tax=Chryseobacterium indologenes TaxID=253 RepID=UPI0003E06BB0|nr:FdhF/YdeP family oxidoreductase [Chryseobacterium indologenes]QPQ51050.1 FdhF/YdeP family oxidoreductase [Chryseobacterium indologenes]GAE65793.1 putative oxidoreductase [Chryseobacterium indologenes NBRC 14944]SFK05720.1 oxidoreductase alpha (molybdopterin) subunit [Chryseobacterium indologenes]SUX49403.1 Formate dehydrogenase H [Chryseobacterium indologenes]
MEENNKKKIEKEISKEPNAENPFSLLDLKLTHVEKAAAGIPAVMAAFSDLFEEKAPIRGMRALLKMNQIGGFDCPSCAWPDPDDERSVLGEYCENGAKALAEEATTKKVTPEFFKENSLYDLAKLDDYQIGKMGRLTDPMYLAPGATHYEPISWDNAFKKIADHLNALESPDEAAFYTSGRTSNEASFVYQLFAKEFGTNNMPDCSNMCHETSGSALRPTIGIGKGTVTLEDFYDAEVIIIIGQNPGTNAPRMMSALAKGKNNGAKIIAVNPLPEAGLMGFINPQNVKAILKGGVQLADLYLPVKINGDMALLKALELLLIEFEKKNPGKVFDEDFIRDKTVGYDEFIKQFDHLKLDELAALSGVSKEALYQAAKMIAFKKRIIISWGMGLTQQPNGVDMIREILNILLLKGSIGKPGAGVCPVRGHSNVQGNRTMMIDEKPTDEQLDRLENFYGFKVPRKHGYDVVRAIKAIHEEKIKVMFCMGGNFLSATPDTTYTAHALRKLNLLVCVSTKLNRGHLVHGKEALILPTYGRSDKDIVNGEIQIVSTENSMGVVQSSKGMLDAVSDNLVNETQIVCRMAMATLGSRSVVDWQLYHDSYDAVRDAIEQCIPGFEDYNIRVREKGGFYLPNAARDEQSFSKELGGRAPFTLTEIPDNTLEDDEYMMATTRTHDQFNTTIYGLDDRYRGIKNERRVIFMNQHDIDKAGFKAGDRVDLYNYDDGIERIAPLFIIVSYQIPEKNTVTYFPETNVLVSVNNVVKESNMPASKYVRIKIKKHDPEVYKKVDEMLYKGAIQRP